MESAVPQVAAGTEPTVEKPASQPYYKSPTEIDASWLVFEKKPDRAAKVAGVKITTFSVGMKPPTTGAAAPAAVAVEAGRGGRGGRGRGGRGGRGAVQKLASLAIKPSSAMRTKYGISIGVPTVGGVKDMTLINYLNEHPRHINALAAGMIPTPPGVHFEIIVFLDPADPEHQRLEELSNEGRDAFEAWVWEFGGIPLKQDHRVNGFVRISDRTEERYIVLTMSTMHTVEAAKFFPTPFYDQKNQIVLWDALVNHSFRAEWEFKVNHVITVSGEKSTFKSYISSCKLIEEPKVSLSDRQLQQEEFLQQMRLAAKSAIASAVANGEDALPKGLSRPATEVNEDEAAASLAALTAGSVASVPAPKAKKPKTIARAPKPKKAPSPPPPPVEVDEEVEEATEDVMISDPEEAPKTPVPQSVMKKLSTRAVA